MPQEKKVNHLSIFLIKQQFTTNHQVIKIEDCDAPVEVAIAGHGAGQLFVRRILRYRRNGRHCLMSSSTPRVWPLRASLLPFSLRSTNAVLSWSSARQGASF